MPPAAEAGTELEPRLEVAGRRHDRREGDQRPGERRRVDRHEGDEQERRRDEPDVPGSSPTGDLLGPMLQTPGRYSVPTIGIPGVPAAKAWMVISPSMVAVDREGVRRAAAPDRAAGTFDRPP